MDKGRAHIKGELAFETGNIKVDLAGKVEWRILLIAAFIEHIYYETGIGTTKIMKDITTALESINDKSWRGIDERTEEE